MYLLDFKFHGELDELDVKISLDAPTIRFRTDVSTSERELGERTFLLANLSKDFYKTPNASEIEFVLGPDLNRSPCCKITLAPSSVGKFVVSLDLRQPLMGRDFTKVDRCVIHFAADVAMLDSFVSDLHGIIKKASFDAQLRGYPLSDI